MVRILPYDPAIGLWMPVVEDRMVWKSSALSAPSPPAVLVKVKTGPSVVGSVASPRKRSRRGCADADFAEARGRREAVGYRQTCKIDGREPAQQGSVQNGNLTCAADIPESGAVPVATEVISWPVAETLPFTDWLAVKWFGEASSGSLVVFFGRNLLLGLGDEGRSLGAPPHLWPLKLAQNWNLSASCTWRRSSLALADPPGEPLMPWMLPGPVAALGIKFPFPSWVSGVNSA